MTPERRPLSEHDRRILAPKNKPVADREALAKFHRDHWFCQVCGITLLDGTAHHIIGGRGGRSDEECNLLYACPHPCHLDWADLTANLAIVLTMKLRAGEMTAADVDRLEALNGCNLPDFAPIPVDLMVMFERNRRDVMANNAHANYVHSWSRISPDSISSIRPISRLDQPHEQESPHVIRPRRSRG